MFNTNPAGEMGAATVPVALIGVSPTELRVRERIDLQPFQSRAVRRVVDDPALRFKLVANGVGAFEIPGFPSSLSLLEQRRDLGRRLGWTARVDSKNCIDPVPRRQALRGVAWFNLVRREQSIHLAHPLENRAPGPGHVHIVVEGRLEFRY